MVMGMASIGWIRVVCYGGYEGGPDMRVVWLEALMMVGKGG